MSAMVAWGPWEMSVSSRQALPGIKKVSLILQPTLHAYTLSWAESLR